ncbi:hypothetical protein Godav_022043, partial [Gossypium davidsonii]|nr:hypothetical protein [Gossypium davidsonii]
VYGASFTFINRCDYTVWPGILANAGTPSLGTTGFELPKDSSRSFQAPTGWSGRFWGRTGCKFDGSGSRTCLTGDCGSGQVECNGLGAAPPVTLAEFTLGTTGGQDFYDVSLVDGYNMPMIVEGRGGSGLCSSTGCTTDLNRKCPSELRVGAGDACKSASYSYAYDDATSTFTCTGADYTVTFCPSSPSKKSSKDATPVPAVPEETTPTTGSTPQGSGSESGLTYSSTTSSTPQGSGSESGLTYSGNGYEYSDSGSGYGYLGSDSISDPDGTGKTMLTDGSWLAGLAMGDSPRTTPWILQYASTSLLLMFTFIM